MAEDPKEGLSDVPSSERIQNVRRNVKQLRGSGGMPPASSHDNQELSDVVIGLLRRQQLLLVEHIDARMVEQVRLVEHVLLPRGTGRDAAGAAIQAAEAATAETESASPPALTGQECLNPRPPPPPPPSCETTADPGPSPEATDPGPSPEATEEGAVVTPPWLSRTDSQLEAFGRHARKEASRGYGRNSLRSRHTQFLQEEEERRATAYAKVDTAWSSEETTPRWQRKLKALIFSTRFEVMIFGAILTNVVFVGFEVDWKTQNPGEPPGIEFLVVDLAYTTLFLIELSLRILADPGDFLAEPNRAWNFFDVFVITTSLCDFIFSMVSIQGASHMRVVRAFRAARILRTVRLVRLIRFLRALRTLMHSIIVTLRSLVWALLLVVMILYGFGVAFTEAVSDHFAESGQLNDDDDLWEYWGSLPRSMFTLYKSVTGGIDWHVVVLPLSSIHGGFVMLFVGFIGFTFFAVLNVITGVFCQSAIQSAQLDKEIASLDLMAHQKAFVEAVTRLFKDIDTDSSGVITIKEFEEHLQKEKCRAYFRSLDIDPSDGWTLFKLLDSNEEGSIDIEEFVNGCLHLKGSAKSIQILKMEHENKIARQLMFEFMECVEGELEAIVGWAGIDLNEEPRRQRRAKRAILKEGRSCAGLDVPSAHQPHRGGHPGAPPQSTS